MWLHVVQVWCGTGVVTLQMVLGVMGKDSSGQSIICNVLVTGMVLADRYVLW
jgi:hypothetical protein